MSTAAKLQQASAPCGAPAEAIFNVVSSFWLSQAVNIVARLGVADLLGEGARSVRELAAATNTHAPSLYRVLRACASSGIFRECADGSFEQTPSSQTLRSDVAGSLRWIVMAELGQEHYMGWRYALEAVRTGGVAFERIFGMSVWQYYGDHPEAADVFDKAMTGITEVIQQAIIASYDFSGCRTVIDVGGGRGHLLGAILGEYPAAHGVLFERAPVIEEAREYMRSAGLDDRVDLLAGDFFDYVPPGGDLYLMKWIVHDWEERRALEILRNCRSVMARDARLLLVETVLPGGNEPHIGKLIDLNMLVMTGGRERTEAEYADLLRRAGFELIEVLPTQSPISLIEARPL